jgi:hypothetical protein
MRADFAGGTPLARAAGTYALRSGVPPLLVRAPRRIPRALTTMISIRA